MRRSEALNVGHSHFIANAPPTGSWKGSFASIESEDPSVDELEGVEDGRGKLLPTSSHLFKLIVPLGNLSRPGNSRHKPTQDEDHGPKSTVPPTVILLHPAQPLSHASRLIQASMAPAYPIVSFRSISKRGQAFQWSESTDIGDFIRDAARSAQFFICLTYEPTKALLTSVLHQNEGKYVRTTEDGETKVPEGQEEPTETVIEIKVPTFADRTRYLRRRLRAVEKEIEAMSGLKALCEKEAHRGARRMAMSGFGGLVVYWATVARLTFWDYGWDVMEPVTYLSGLSMVILGYLWFLYQGREVSYTSVLAQSITNRKNNLYKAHGFDIERWMDLVSSRRALRKEIGRIAEDYEENEAKEYVEHDGLESDKHDSSEVLEESVVDRKDEKVGKLAAIKTNRDD